MRLDTFRITHDAFTHYAPRVTFDAANNKYYNYHGDKNFNNHHKYQKDSKIYSIRTCRVAPQIQHILQNLQEIRSKFKVQKIVKKTTHLITKNKFLQLTK